MEPETPVHAAPQADPTVGLAAGMGRTQKLTGPISKQSLGELTSVGRTVLRSGSMWEHRFPTPPQLSGR